MRRLKRYLMPVAALLFLLLMPACKPEELITYYGEKPDRKDGTWAEMPLTIAPATEAGGTKASLLKDVEARGSGALVLVFRSDTRRLATSRFFRQDELDNQGAVPLRLHVPLAQCDFYILGNLNAIRRSDGAAVNLLEALDASFPLEENTLEALVYRLDGGDLGGGFRRETFADVASCGIPYALIRKNVNTASLVGSGQNLPDADRCSRLFSKVTVRIDHGAFDGGGANPEFFVNTRLYLRQANGRLQPFSGQPQRAQEAADILVQSDFDPDMQSTNASVTTFSFYVPENMQGTLLPGNTDSRRKTRDELIARNLSAVEPYLTYMEFCGHLNPAAGGYGGDVTYRFYLGRDNCSNFDLERGREHKVSLSFRVGSIFDSDWRVEPSLLDTRNFALTADASFTTDIGAVNGSRLVAVRKSRPGAFYVYMNPLGSLGGTNLLLGKEASSSAAYSPTSLSDCSWYGAFLQSGTEDAAWLADHGISASWDKATGRLAFKVTDAAKFEARKADPARTFSVKLLPGGTITADFRIGLYDDLQLSVDDGKSLTEEFYMGQKRHLTVSGFSSADVRYAAVQGPCGTESGAAQNCNRQWKTVNTGGLSGGFPSCAVDGNGNPVLDPSNGAYAGQVYAGGLDVYAWYPNRFQGSHGWASRDGKIVFFTSDWLNDSLEVPVRVQEPRLAGANEYVTIYRLPLDGTPVATADYGYKVYDGSAPLAQSSFDPTLYASLLSLSAQVSDGLGDCMGYDMTAHTLYCSDTRSPTYGDLAAKELSPNGVVRENGSGLTGDFSVVPNGASGLFGSGPVYRTRFYFTAPVLDAISVDGSNWNTGSSSTVTVNYFKSSVNQFEDDESFWISLKYRFVNSDLLSLNIAPDGAKTTYTVGSTTYGPVYRVEADSYDTGEGGELRWVYDESAQVQSAPGGVSVPGGLLLPYGPQGVRFSFRNRHSGRDVVVVTGKSVTLQYSTPFAFFVGATNRRNAQVFLVPAKNVKYLKRCAATATRAQRTWMTQLFGHRSWSDNTLIDKAYPHANSGFAAYHVVYSNSTSKSFPLDNFDIQYAPSSGSLSRWTNAGITKLNDQIPGDYSSRCFSPNTYSAFMIMVRRWPVENGKQHGAGLGSGFSDARNITIFDGNKTYISPSGTIPGSVHGTFVNTTDLFAD